MDSETISILIATKNRIEDLKVTLQKIIPFCNETIICSIIDDGSNDGTFEYVTSNYPQIYIARNETSKGYLFCRNKMLNEAQTKYAMSLDDDAHFLTNNITEIISYFSNNPKCGVIAARIFWGTSLPNSIETNDKVKIVKGFVGCGHIWNLQAWKQIPNYPEWYQFYGEEDFASYHLFKKNWEIHYLPQFFVHHRVIIKQRKGEKDYFQRSRNSLKAGWYNYYTFLPKNKLFQIFMSSIWGQIKNKMFKFDVKGTLAFFFAIFDFILNLKKINTNSRFTNTEWENFNQLENTKIYWKPKNEPK